MLIIGEKTKQFLNQIFIEEEMEIRKANCLND